MIEIVSDNPIEIPRIWSDILAVEQMPEDALKSRGVHVADPKLYRDDRREVCFSSGQYKVFIILCSGNTNYWLDYEVWEGVNLLYDSNGDPDFEVPDSVTINDSQNNYFKVNIPVKLV